MQALTDEQLVENLRTVGPPAFAQLYHRYKHRVYAYCYRLLRHPQNAEDATQETFLKVHRSLDQLATVISLPAWILTIARNEAFMILRRTRPAEQLEVVEEDVWDTVTPLEATVQKEKSEIVQQCLLELRSSYREVLVLREYEQLSYGEIAAVTGLTIGAVKSAIFKGRKAMGKRLDSIYKEREGI